MKKLSSPRGAPWKPASDQRDLISLVVGAVCLILVIAMCVVATELRPIWDDYCMGSVATQGFVSALETWFTTWSGDLTARASDTLLLGLPLAHWPWSVASAVAFLTTSILAVLAIYSIAGQGKERQRRALVWAGAPMFLVAWWAWWAAPMALGGTNDVSLTGVYVFNWQNIGTGYLVPMLILTSAWVLLWRSGMHRMPVWLSAALALLIGLLGGLSGAVFAVSSFVWLVAWAAYLLATRRARGRLDFAVLGAGAAGLMAGLGIALTSPGAQARAAQLADLGTLEPKTPWSLFAWTMPRAMSDWALGIFSLGLIPTVLLGVTVGAVVLGPGTRQRAAALATRGAGVLAFSLLLEVVNRASEAFAYPAPWHLVAPRAMAFLGITVLAAAAGQLVGKRLLLRRSLAALFASLAIGGLVVAAISLGSVAGDIQDRRAAWDSGPAPIAGLTDTEQPYGYVTVCWKRLAAFRGSDEIKAVRLRRFGPAARP